MTINNHQVLQCGLDGSAPVVLDTGEQVTLPTGGPYEVGGAEDVLVGELWVLAGQSNMEGVGDLVDVETPHERVRSYQSREQGAVAEEPLHWLGESPRLVHHIINGGSAVPDEISPRDGGRTKGAGLGLTFAKERLARTHMPIGLIPAAHGGTSMTQWNPALKDQGGASLYGATLERVRANGGKVAGILWYQGESDCEAEALVLYSQRMTALVQSFRDDLGQPDLPFCFVQIGGVVSDPDPDGIDGWNGIREAQRVWAAAQAHVLMVSAIDLGLDDAIHISTPDLKRLGRRMADATDGVSAPALHGAAVENDGLSVRIGFDHVRGGLVSLGRPAGFSLRLGSGREMVRIYKTTLQGDSVVLHLAETLPRGADLWYGWGLNPYCNITDREDGAVPAFGPIALS